MEWKWYFFLPLLLLLFVNNIGKRLLPWLLLVSFVLLAFLSVSGDHSDNTRYYAFWQRCFALMAGTFLATINIRVLAERIPSALHSVLSAMALVSLVYIGATARATAGYPNLYTLWVVLATAILMILGARIEPTGYARQNRLLASKPFTLLGKLSYSLYIWHWPIFVFARYTQVEVTRWETVGLVLLSLVAAILSYVLIENPLRKCHKKATFMATLILLVILPIAFAHRFEGKSERDLPAGFAEDIAKFQGCITPQEITDELRARCKFGDMSKEPTVLLMGDSWSGRFAIFVDHMLADAGLAGFTLTSGHNLPFVNTEQLGLNRMVKANNDQHFRDIAAGKYRYVVVANSMPRYFAVHRSGSQDIRLLSRGRYRSYEAAFRESFDNTLAFIIDNGAVPVFITGLYDRISQIYSPTWGNINYSRCNEFGEECSYEDTSDPYSLEMKAIMAAMQAKYPQMVILDIHSLLCQDGKCSASIDGLPLYSDIGGHITPYASKRLSEMYLAEHENPFIRGHSF
jgi:hypothetical protein